MEWKHKFIQKYKLSSALAPRHVEYFWARRRHSAWICGKIETSWLTFRWKANNIWNTLALSELSLLFLFLQAKTCSARSWTLVSFIVFLIQFKINKMITVYCIRVSLLNDDFLKSCFFLLIKGWFGILCAWNDTDETEMIDVL